MPRLPSIDVYRRAVGKFFAPPSEPADLKTYVDHYKFQKKLVDNKKVPRASHLVLPDRSVKGGVSGGKIFVPQSARRVRMFFESLATELDWTLSSTSVSRCFRLVDCFNPVSGAHAFDQDILFTGSWTASTDEGEILNLLKPIADSVRIFTPTRPQRFIVLTRDVKQVKNDEGQVLYKKTGTHIYCPDLIITPEHRKQLNSVVSFARQNSGFSAIGNMRFTGKTIDNNFEALFDVSITSLRMPCCQKNHVDPGAYRFFGEFVLSEDDSFLPVNNGTKQEFAIAFSSGSSDLQIETRMKLLRLTALFLHREDVVEVNELKRNDFAKLAVNENFELPSSETKTSKGWKIKNLPSEGKNAEQSALLQNKRAALATIARQILNDYSHALNPEIKVAKKGTELKYIVEFSGPGFCWIKSHKFLQRGSHGISGCPDLRGECLSDHIDRLLGQGRKLVRHKSRQSIIEVMPGFACFHCWSCLKTHHVAVPNNYIQHVLFGKFPRLPRVTTRFKHDYKANKSTPKSTIEAMRVIQQDRAEACVGQGSMLKAFKERLYNV